MAHGWADHEDANGEVIPKGGHPTRTPARRWRRFPPASNSVK